MSYIVNVIYENGSVMYGARAYNQQTLLSTKQTLYKILIS